MFIYFHVVSGTNEKNNISAFLPWMSYKATKGLIALPSETYCDQAIDLPLVISAVFLIAHFGKIR
jgi:hypothetical protein